MNYNGQIWQGYCFKKNIKNSLYQQEDNESNFYLLIFQFLDFSAYFICVWACTCVHISTCVHLCMHKAPRGHQFLCGWSHRYLQASSLLLGFWDLKWSSWLHSAGSQPLSHLFSLQFNIFSICINVRLPEEACASCVCLGPEEDRKRHQVFWNRSGKWMWATLWVLETKPGSPARAESALATDSSL